ncbi:MAG: TetR/AcrR family transcriptional regulator [Spirochaetaceae bacterium]|jgi:AcrR family transcriptional regulator|nr:TetR/AcrR family transcriptional regulator [Spirochaetaceae bacterium]GMO22249.1 MAG: hypothetical protein Pg6A_09540 [Termitinemataceae bacterium]
MARFVEHDERREGIIENALDVFIEVGFESATFQKIADRARVTRTILYQYFKDKLELFHFSIKHFLGHLEEDITGIDRAKSAVEKLILIIRAVFTRLEKNRKLLIVILNFIVNNYKDTDTSSIKYYISRRTIRFRRKIAVIVIDGINSGELRAVKVHTVNEIIFSFIEAAVLELAVLKKENLRSALSNFESCIKLFAK